MECEACDGKGWRIKEGTVIDTKPTEPGKCEVQFENDDKKITVLMEEAKIFRKNFSWRRPTVLDERGEICLWGPNGPQMSDVKQTGGTCYISSVLAVTARMQKAHIMNMIHPCENKPGFDVYLCWHGKPKPVYVDDTFPTKTVTAFREQGMQYYWSAVIEKAIAKLYYNSYVDMGEGGRAERSYSIITGEICTKTMLPTAKDSTKQKLSDNKLITEIQGYLKKKYILTASTDPGESDWGHAMGVYDCYGGKVFLLEPNNSKQVMYDRKRAENRQNWKWLKKADPVQGMPGCFKLDFAKFRELFLNITVCWFGAYERVELSNGITSMDHKDAAQWSPEKGYTIKTTKKARNKHDVVIAVYESGDALYGLGQEQERRRTKGVFKSHVVMKFKRSSRENTKCRYYVVWYSSVGSPLDENIVNPLSPTNSWVLKTNYKSLDNTGSKCQVVAPGAIAIYIKKKSGIQPSDITVEDGDTEEMEEMKKMKRWKREDTEKAEKMDVVSVTQKRWKREELSTWAAQKWIDGYLRAVTDDKYTTLEEAMKDDERYLNSFCGGKKKILELIEQDERNKKRCRRIAKIANGGSKSSFHSQSGASGTGGVAGANARKKISKFEEVIARGCDSASGSDCVQEKKSCLPTWLKVVTAVIAIPSLIWGGWYWCKSRQVRDSTCTKILKAVGLFNKDKKTILAATGVTLAAAAIAATKLRSKLNSDVSDSESSSEPRDEKSKPRSIQRKSSVGEEKIAAPKKSLIDVNSKSCENSEDQSSLLSKVGVICGIFFILLLFYIFMYKGRKGKERIIIVKKAPQTVVADLNVARKFHKFSVARKFSFIPELLKKSEENLVPENSRSSPGNHARHGPRKFL